MILEHALLPVKPGQEAAFEAAFAEAKALIISSPGCRRVEVSRCLERPSTYLLLVEWDSLEAHVEGFRGSEAFTRWRELLHHFYDPAPLVEHFERVDGAEPA